MYDIKRLTESIKRLTNVGIALSATQDINAFFELILKEAMFFTNADAGTVYTVSDDQQHLDFKVVCTKSKKLHMGTADTSKWPPVQLYDADGNKRMKNFVAYVYHTKEPKKINDVYKQDLFDASGTKKYDRANNYKSISMAAIPLKNHENDILGVVQLINAIDDDGEIVPFAKRNIIFLDSLASQAAIALSNKKLIQNLEKLLHQFIKSIAKAIDRKSKNTGGHITRVATLSEMLFQKVNEDNTIFKDYKFDEDEIQELSIAGWMHDVGKITTPVYIMDKSKKLETIFDRIEMVKTRIDMVIAIIERDKALAPKEKYGEFDKIINEVKEYKEILITCNESSEYMNDEIYNKLTEIFTFNYSSEGKNYFIITEDEFNNLSIRKGTLIPKEMEKMHEHASVTLELLDELTFPKKFRNVPLFAASHHEKLNGKGYPSQLTEDELPLQARVIAVADIFEALTASDRPYKSDKTLSQTFKILAFMAKDRDIDPDLLTLFIDSGLFTQYANIYLKPHQIDDVDFEIIKKIYQN
ncbi:MAG: HD domain-containing protein [Candidatus Cloacimonetes bacterium]|nr:HD domain-containing protein [Candidatus Cloacimonadota bacterium]MCF7814478.1 HD domain-containing protein [Candidatus Cloacimonadota bacterium]MCF7867870.1 HD domain-containing protein [Candidatus Cloacimonadota bacterium]MCF7883689.1 HD domain-containing protein [Candidatus Cloacimonadota bacterium]